MEKCIIYLRQSMGEIESCSIQQQRILCTKKAKELNFDVAEAFKDDSVSGKTYPICYSKIADLDQDFQNWYSNNSKNKKYRQGLSDAIEYSIKNNIKNWIVIDSTRIQRNAENSLLEKTLSQFFVNNKITIHQVQGESIDLSKFDQKIVNMIRTAINDEQIKKTREKSLKGIHTQKNKGIITNFSSLGVKKDGNNLAWNDDIIWIKYCFEAVLKNVKMMEILRYVNDTYYSNKSEHFALSSLHRVLRNPVYILKMNNVQGELIDIVNHNTVQAIDDYTFYKVQDILSKRVGVKVFKNTFLPLSGLIYCSKCGKRMTSCSDIGGLRYSCKTHMVSKNKCSLSRRLKADYDEFDLAGILQVCTPLCLLTLIDKYNNILNSDNIKNKIKALEVEDYKIKEKLDFVSNQFFRDELSNEDYQIITQKPVARRKEITNEIAYLKSQVNVADNESKKELNDKINKLLLHAQLLDNELELLLKDTISKIVVFDNHVEIFLTVGKSFELPFLEKPVFYRGRKNKGLPPVGVMLDDKNNIEIYYFTEKLLDDKDDITEQKLLAEYDKVKIYIAK